MSEQPDILLPLQGIAMYQHSLVTLVLAAGPVDAGTVYMPVQRDADEREMIDLALLQFATEMPSDSLQNKTDVATCFEDLCYAKYLSRSKWTSHYQTDMQPNLLQSLLHHQEK